MHRAVVLGALVFLQLSLCESVTHAGRRFCRQSRRCRPCATVVVAPISAAPIQPQIVTPQGTRHRIISSNETDPDEFDERAKRASEPPAARSLRWDGSDGETFSGLARRAAKTSISSAPIEPFDTVVELLNEIPADDDMRDGDPDIEHGADSDRVAEEDMNVSVPAYLYAASKEDDNDFHLIIGGEANDSEQFMNVEVSGLPISGPDRDDIEAVREQFANVLDGQLPGNRYDFYDPPIPINVAGSMFYDIDHPPGQVGPASLRDGLNTSWEIHPITKIEVRNE